MNMLTNRIYLVKSKGMNHAGDTTYKIYSHPNSTMTKEVNVQDCQKTEIDAQKHTVISACNDTQGTMKIVWLHPEIVINK